MSQPEEIGGGAAAQKFKTRYIRSTSDRNCQRSCDPQI